MPRLDGIDISNHQGVAARNLSVQPAALVKWAHDKGVRGVWFKASEGTVYQDPYYRAWRHQAADLGFEFRGAYHWLTPGSSIALQLANFVNQVGELAAGECIQLDCEQAGLADAEVLEAYQRWTDRYGDRVIVYCGRFFGPVGAPGAARSYLIDRLPADVPWWLPWYDSTPSGLPRQPTIWQWGGGAQGAVMDPIRARVDSNQIEDEAKLRSLSGYPPRAPDVISNQEDDMPLSDDDKAWIEGHVHDQAFAAVIQVLRSTEAMRIIWQQSRPDAPFPPDPAPSPGGQG